MDLKDKVVLITGGAVRIGRAISLELAAAGCKISCHYNHSQKAALLLKKEIEHNQAVIHLLRADLKDKDTPVRLVQRTIDIFSKVDILINNAAIFLKTPIGTVTPDNWDNLHNLNLKAAFFLTQEASRHMLKNKSGKIINIGDAGAENPFPGYIPYSITKAGVMAMTRGLAKALAPHVQVNCINPGPVMMPEGMSAEEKEFALQQTVLKREGSAQDVARTVRFLLEGSDYITGAMIPVDGGRHIR